MDMVGKKKPGTGVAKTLKQLRINDAAALRRR
jgi:hypothetical protein